MQRAPLPSIRLRLAPATLADLRACQAMIGALDGGSSVIADDAAREAFRNLRRLLRKQCARAGIDPDEVILADLDERAARAAGERPRMRARESSICSAPIVDAPRVD